MKKLIILAMAIAVTASGIAFAQESKNTFTYKVGDYEVILLSEGQNDGNTSVLLDATPEMIQKTMPDGSYPTAMNAFLVKTPEKIYLIDTGLGRKLLENLDAVGVSPNQINTVIITHMHGDHIGGLLREGKNVFPNAQIILSEAECAYWTSDEEMNKVPENRRNGFLSARNVLTAYSSELQIIKPEKLEEKSGNGIYMIEAYGHTPGHIGCLLKSGNEQLFIWADLVHAYTIQLPYPQVAMTYDVNPKQAIETRKKIFEYVAKHKIPVAGMHLPYPSIGKVEASSGGGYVLQYE